MNGAQQKELISLTASIIQKVNSVEFREDVVRTAHYLFDTVLEEIRQKAGDDLTPEELKALIIQRVLWHYSLLNLFIAENGYSGDLSEWLTEKQTEGYYDH